MNTHVPPEASDLSATYSFDSLSPADTGAICAHLGLPTPTPDVPLRTIAEDAGHTAGSVWAALRDTTSIRLMIAAAALRGSVQRLAPDPQLAPLPHRPAPVRTPRSAAESARNPAPPPLRPDQLPASDRVLTLVAPNPKRPSSESWHRYQKYAVGMDESALLAAGVRAADLRWDLERGFIAWGPRA